MMMPNMPANQDIPTSADAPPDQGAGEMSPVIEALKTIQVFIAAVKEKDPGKGQAMEQSLLQLAQTMKGAQQAGAQPPSNETEGESPTPAPPGIGYPGVNKMGPSRGIPMNANKGAVPIM